MLIDLTLEISKELQKNSTVNEVKVSYGHIGTHFDVMNKIFPLEFVERNAIVFNVSSIKNRDINIEDIQSNLIKENMFIAFYSGYIDEIPYGSKEYFSKHPQLSNEILEFMLKKKISIIGIDWAGVRRGKEHTVMDQYCANRGVFIVENLCNVKEVIKTNDYAYFIANTYPLNYKGLTGLPCRVIAKV